MAVSLSSTYSTTFVYLYFVLYHWTDLEYLTTLLFDGDDYGFRRTQSPTPIFCFVLAANDRHLTSSRSIIYSWGKRCDRFYFVTRLQNTSVDLMMLPKYENTSDIKPATITQTTLDVLLQLREDQLAQSYDWFLRGSDDSYVVIPNLRRLIARLDRKEAHQPFVYVGDVEQMYEKYQFSMTGSVMLFNRKALDRLTAGLENDGNDLNSNEQKCLDEMIYDHQFVKCIKQLGIDINSANENLILSQNLSTYRMDRRLKGLCCSPNTVAFRSSNETDMFKFDFFYHHLDALSKINPY